MEVYQLPHAYRLLVPKQDYAMKDQGGRWTSKHTLFKENGDKLINHVGLCIKGSQVKV